MLRLVQAVYTNDLCPVKVLMYSEAAGAISHLNLELGLVILI